jgi:hypothetical protein
MDLDAMMTNPPATAEETRAVVRLREVGVIPALMGWSESLKYAREHNMITPYLTTEAALAAQRTATQMPNAAILPGAVKGDGEWVVEELATLLNDLLPKLVHIAYRAELAGEDEAQELAGALFYTARVGCDNLEIIMEDTARHDQ